MGRKQTKSGKIRLTEVAKLAGVSPITASRFFRNPEALSLSKRERVDSAVKELGYVPNLAARALASHRTEVIGVVIPSLTNNVFADVLRGIYDSSEGSRYSIQLANTRYSILQEEKLLRLFRAQKPAGLIVTGINQTAESRTILESMNCPVTQIMEIGDSPVDMMVGFSHYDAGFCGHFAHSRTRRRRIGFLGARMDPRVQRRFEGLSRCHEGGLAVRPEPRRHDFGADHRHARRDAVRRSACAGARYRRGLLRQRRPCARRAVRMPAPADRRSRAIWRLSASTTWNSWLPPSPSLTSVRTNRYEMGRHAVTMVIDAIEGRRPQEPVIDLGFQLMVRESSMPQSS